MPIEYHSAASSEIERSSSQETLFRNMDLKSAAHPRANSIIKFEEDKFHSARIALREDIIKLVEFYPEGSRERLLFEKDMESFYLLFLRFLRSVNEKKLDWNIVKGPSAEKLIPYNVLGGIESGSPEARTLLSKLAVIKLNGGLGTTMGCVGPKSVIEVREGLTFLDLSVRQIEVGELNLDLIFV